MKRKQRFKELKDKTNLEYGKRTTEERSKCLLK